MFSIHLENTIAVSKFVLRNFNNIVRKHLNTAKLKDWYTYMNNILMK